MCFKIIDPENNLVSYSKRNWSIYCPSELLNHIVLKPIQLIDVQSQWNSLENSLITAVDAVAPLILVKQNCKHKSSIKPPSVKKMSNRRKHLLRLEKLHKDGRHLAEIRQLNKSIRNHFAEKRKSKVRCAVNGQKGNIWKAVGVAKDLNPDAIPSNLTLRGASVDPSEVACAFAKHFAEKIKSNVSKTLVNVNGVYNGKCRLFKSNNNTGVPTLVQPGIRICMLCEWELRKGKGSGGKGGVW